MTEFYLPTRALHITCVVLSGALFSLRGLAMLVRSPWANHRIAKRLSVTIDSVLLLAGVALMVQTQQYPGTHAWLSVKLLLLLAYIVLGIFALRRGRGYGSRATFFFAAIAVYLFMFSVARTHAPLGLFHAL